MRIRRRPGRPRLAPGDTSTHLTLTLPTKHYDALARQAVRAAVSVPELVRRQLEKNRQTRQ
jgi:hypothetical protein